MLHDMKYAEAVAKAPHMIALGDTRVYLRSDEGFPWEKASDVESGNSHRLVGPSSCYIIAREAGLEFRLNVDFEGRDANGCGVSLFERDRLREVMRKLPPATRAKFAKMLRDEVLPGMEKRTAELREAINLHADSEDCVRGLLAYAAQQ